RFAIFIDGLDKFDGDHSDVINLVLWLRTQPNVKICLASRPWNVFSDALKSRISLCLERL
ncbi:hypothetical protein BDY21DRAFT_263984, partial [Lineolata rhizophorae]